MWNLAPFLHVKALLAKGPTNVFVDSVIVPIVRCSIFFVTFTRFVARPRQKPKDNIITKIVAKTV